MQQKLKQLMFYIGYQRDWQSPLKSFWILKQFHIAGDFNLNVLDHDNCKKVQNFLNLLYLNNMILIINKPTRVTKRNSNSNRPYHHKFFCWYQFDTNFYQSDASDHITVCVFLSSMIDESKNEVMNIYLNLLKYF